MKVNLIEKVKTTICQHDLLRRGDSVLIAVSGGADSVCLLDVMVSLKDEFSLTLYAAHVNHMLRADEADRDEAFVRALCEQYGVPLFSCRTDVAQLAKWEKLSIEEAGRKARYTFFADLKAAHGIVRVATAHNKNDNVETVCMRFMRGTGMKGLSGIPIQNDASVIRPLLFTSREEIEAHLNEKQISYVTDSSNLTDAYERNKVRHSLVPHITAHHNPNFVDTLSSNIEVYTEAEHFLEHCAQSAFARVATETEFGFQFSVAALHAEDRFIAKRVILKAIQACSPLGVSGKTLQAIYRMTESQTNQSVCISKSLTAYTAYGKLFLVREKVKPKFSRSLIEGNVYFPEIGYTLSCTKGKDAARFSDKNTLYLKDGIAPDQLTVRTRQPGDRIFLGNCGHKKVKDLLIDEKIPSFLRDDIPILLFENKIIWVCGVRDNPSFRPQPGDAYMKISYQKEKNHA